MFHEQLQHASVVRRQTVTNFPRAHAQFHGTDTAVVIADDLLTWVLLLVPEDLVPQTRGDLFWKSSLIKSPFCCLSFRHVFYTHHSGETSSTIDYIITNRASSGFLTSCRCFCDHPLIKYLWSPSTVHLTSHVTSPESQRLFYFCKLFYVGVTWCHVTDVVNDWGSHWYNNVCS